MKFLNNIDLSTYQLLNAVVQNMANAGSLPSIAGRIAFDTKAEHFMGVVGASDSLGWSKFLMSRDIVNDFTQGGDEKILSASKGKALYDSITRIDGYFQGNAALNSLKLGGYGVGELLLSFGLDGTNGFYVNVGGNEKKIPISLLKSTLQLGEYSSLNLASDIVHTGKFTIEGKTTLGDAVINALSVTNGVTAGSIKSNGALEVVGATTLKELGATTITASGKGTFNGELEVKGATKLANLNASNASFSGTLGVTGDSTLNNISVVSIKVGGATLTWDADNGVLMSDKSIASMQSIATRGVGASSSGGGALVSWSALSNDMIPDTTGKYDIGSSAKRWKSVYGTIGNFNQLSANEIGAQALSVNGTMLLNSKSVATESYVDERIASSATKVSFLPNITDGNKIGTITIDGGATDLFAPTDANTLNGYLAIGQGFVTNADGTSTYQNTLKKNALIYFTQSVSSYWTKFADIVFPNANEDRIVTLYISNQRNNVNNQGSGIVELRIRNSSGAPQFDFNIISGDLKRDYFRFYYPSSVVKGTLAELWVYMYREWQSIAVSVLSETSAYTNVNCVRLYQGSRTKEETPTLENYALPTDFNICGNAATATYATNAGNSTNADNATKLGGKESNRYAVMDAIWYQDNVDADALLDARFYINATGNGTGSKNFPTGYGRLFSWGDDYTRTQLYASTENDLYFRAQAKNLVGAKWKQIAFVDSTVKVGGRTGEIDLDTLNTNGTYFVDASSANKPAAYGQMLVMRNGDTTAQVYVGYTGGYDNIYFRGWTDSNGASAWKTVLSSDNYYNIINNVKNADNASNLLGISGDRYSKHYDASAKSETFTSYTTKVVKLGTLNIQNTENFESVTLHVNRTFYSLGGSESCLLTIYAADTSNGAKKIFASKNTLSTISNTLPDDVFSKFYIYTDAANNAVHLYADLSANIYNNGFGTFTVTALAKNKYSEWTSAVEYGVSLPTTNIDLVSEFGAIKLHKTRNLWGQPFDGSADVNNFLQFNNGFVIKPLNEYTSDGTTYYKSIVISDSGTGQYLTNNTIASKILNVYGNTVPIDSVSWLLGAYPRIDATSVAGAGAGLLLGGFGSDNKGAGIAAVMESVWWNTTGLAFYTNHGPSNAFSEKMRLTNNGNLIPKYSTVQTLGDSSNRWGSLYVGSGNFSGNVAISGSLSVTYDIKSDRSVLAGVGSEYGLYMTGGDTFGQLCVHQKGSWVSSNIFLYPSGFTQVMHDFNVKGYAQLDSILTVSGAATLNSSLKVYGGTTINSTLDVLDNITAHKSLVLKDENGNSATLEYKNGVLITNVPFASMKSIATRGNGVSSDGSGDSGSGLVDWGNFQHSILPIQSQDKAILNLGSTDHPWANVYANNMYIGGKSVTEIINSSVGKAVDDIIGGNLEENLNSLYEIIEKVKSVENVVVKRFNQLIEGNGTTTTFDINHSLYTKKVMVFIYEGDFANGNVQQQVYADVYIVDERNVRIEFANAPKQEEKYSVVILA